MFVTKKKKENIHMNKTREIAWYDLKDEELKEFVTFIRTSLEKDSTFKAMVNNIKAALNNRHLGIRTYIPTLEATILCEGQDLLNIIDDMTKEMPLANDTTNQRTKVMVGLPQGCGGVDASNLWFVNMDTRAQARSIAKGYSQHDIMVIGFEVKDHAIMVHVACKDEIVAYMDELGNGDGHRVDFQPFTSKSLTRLMGYAA